MVPNNHLDGDEDGEEGEDGNAPSAVSLSKPAKGDFSVAALVNNMKQLNIERERVKEDKEDEDDECLLQTLTIQVSYEERG